MKKITLTPKHITSAIHLIRDQRVLLDQDLARMYGVKVKALIQAVKRNRKRFPEDFMFQLDWEEARNSRSQFVTLKQGRNIKYRPYAFTEQGIAMLSGVLRSSTAVRVNIAIMRAFARLRRIVSHDRALARKLSELEHQLENHDEQIRNIIMAIRELASPVEPSPKGRIGFHP